jgi:hypothetical protein
VCLPIPHTHRRQHNDRNIGTFRFGDPFPSLWSRMTHASIRRLCVPGKNRLSLAPCQRFLSSSEFCLLFDFECNLDLGLRVSADREGTIMGLMVPVRGDTPGPSVCRSTPHSNVFFFWQGDSTKCLKCCGRKKPKFF